jgi:hypothetical protein
MVKHEQLALLRKYRTLGDSIKVCAKRADVTVQIKELSNSGRPLSN